MGSNRFRVDMPRYIDLYLDGRLKLDELVSRRIGLDEVNDGFDAMKAGEVARSRDHVRVAEAPPRGGAGRPSRSFPQADDRAAGPAVPSTRMTMWCALAACAISLARRCRPRTRRGPAVPRRLRDR